jgi:hypothetical protein
MPRREIIIIVLMIIAVLFGGYSFFYTSPSKTDIEGKGKGLEALNKFIVDVAENLKKKDLSEADNYIIQQALAEWKREPFLKPQLYVKLEEEDSDQEEEVITAQELNLIYSGYLEAVDKQLAIINGMEYEIGEMLGQEGYFIKSIFPTRVVIGIMGSKNDIILPIEETDTLSLEKTD